MDHDGRMACDSVLDGSRGALFHDGQMASGRAFGAGDHLVNFLFIFPHDIQTSKSRKLGKLNVFHTFEVDSETK